MIIGLLLLLNFKHLIVDGFIQSRFPYHWQQKGTWGAKGGIHHAALHGLFTFLILLLATNVWMATWIAIAEFDLHYIIDWAKMNINRIKRLTPNDGAFWDWLMVDQFAHQVCYIGIIWLIFGGKIG